MIQLQSAIINGITLHWLDIGQGEPVVFIPGAIGDYRSWTYQTEEFAKHFRVIVLSRRFQYPSKYPKGGSSSVSDNCDDLLGLFQHLSINKVTLIGHSYGGYIALAFAEKYADMVDKLVLEEPSVFGFITNSPYNPLKLIPVALKDVGAAISLVRSGLNGVIPSRIYLARGQFEKAKLAVAEGLFGHKVTLEGLNPVLLQTLEDNIATFEGDSRNAFDYPLTRGKLKKVNTETLLLSSSHSPRWFGYICRELKEILPHADWIILPSPTHWLHLNLPVEFNQTAIRFIQKV